MIEVCAIANGKFASLRISEQLYQRLRKKAWDTKRSLGVLLKEAWSRYGVSVDAIDKYLSE